MAHEAEAQKRRETTLRIAMEIAALVVLVILGIGAMSQDLAQSIQAISSLAGIIGLPAAMLYAGRQRAKRTEGVEEE